MTIANSDAAPSTTATIASCDAGQRAQNRTAGTRSRASPMTPPSPVGSGQCRALRQAGGEAGREHACRRARAAGACHSRSNGAMGRDAPAPDRDRQHQHGRGEAEQLHQQIGADRAGRAEQIAHRRVGGVAERGVLHRPGGERAAHRHRERDQREAAAFADAAPDHVAQVVGPRKRARSKAVESEMTSHGVSPAPRRGDAAPRPWFPCPARARRGCSRCRDCGRRRRRARDSGRG